MKLSEILEFNMRKRNVMIKAEPVKRSIIMSIKEETMTPDTHILTVLKVGPEVEGINIGDRVLTANAALVRLPVDDLELDSYIFYTEESFVKMVQPTKEEE